MKSTVKIAYALTVFLFGFGMFGVAYAGCGGHHASAHMGSKDIIDTAVSSGSFKTLVAAIEAAGLAEALRSEGPFTVFAPTDEAFSKLAPGTVEELLKPANKEKLQSILTYHVVPEKLMGSDLREMYSAKTLNGTRVTLGMKYRSMPLTVQNAGVVVEDIETSNGVIHAIDTVMIPD